MNQRHAISAMNYPEEKLPALIRGGSYTSVPGTQVGVAQGGIRAGNRNDVAVLYAHGIAAGVVTTSTAAAAPCLYVKNLLPGFATAVVVNSGNANAATGEQGVIDTRQMAETTARVLKVPPSQVLVCSTGVIGRPLPMDRVLPAVTQAAAHLNGNGRDAAEAILTTDTFTKEAACTVGAVTVGGIAKGSGMIHPNMATMLGFLATDAQVAPELLQQLISVVADRSFNAITVDGDMSTNDTLIIQATGRGAVVEEGNQAFADLELAIYAVCRHLAREIARDGEGAEHLIECTVEGLEEERARHVAREVIRSPLVKTAIHGRDANWGRIVGALGALGVGRLNELDLDMAGIPVLRAGQPVPVDEEAATLALTSKEVRLHIRLPGNGIGRAWGCDLSAGYVRINADYRS
jgi:glutamate N-acetyltransferase/amino-acid N-acetyltransferase